MLRLSCKIILANLKIWCSKMQPFSGNQHPDLLHVSYTAPATRNASLQILFKCPTPAIVFRTATKPSQFAHFWQLAGSLAPATRNDIWTSKSGPSVWCFFTLWLRNVLRATFSTSQLPKVLRHSVFYILTSTCASRHNGVHFFIILTSKRAPALMCFAHFYFEICFAPQRRALFKHLNFQKCSDSVFYIFDFDMCFPPQWRALFHHLNFQKCSDVEVLLAFWLPNVLRATTACNCHLSSAQLALHPPLLGAYFSTLLGPKRLFYLFACIFFLQTLSLLWSSSLLFSDFSRLCFFICPYCRKFDFKTSFDKYILYVGWATKWELRITPPGYANTFELRDDPPSTMAFHPWPSPIVYAHMAYPIGTGCLTSWWDKSTLLNIKVGKKNTHRCLAIRTFVHYPFELSWYMYI